MPGIGITLEGEREFRATVRRAVDDLQDLSDLNREVGEYLVETADPPHETGYLDASGHVESDAAGATLIWDAPYAGPQYYGVPGHNIEPHPWAMETVQHTESRWTDMYVDGLQRILNQVKGI